MKRLTALATIALGFAALGMAAEFKGFVEDKNCAAKPAMKGNAECAAKCVKGGSPAVLVAEDGKVYEIKNQDKITSFAGKNVTVMGSLADNAITVESVK